MATAPKIPALANIQGSQGAVYSDTLTPAEETALVARLKAAWAALPPDTQAAVKPLLDNAHYQLSKFLTDGTAPDHDVHQVLQVKSLLTNDWEGLAQKQKESLAAITPIEVSIGSEGQMLGTGKYQELDPGWGLVTGSVWLENLLQKHPFPPGQPAPVQIPDQVTIAMIGDFGTGNFGATDSPSTKISRFVENTLKPDITIHLGDVYYAGTSGEETSNLLNFWPQGGIASFALNSNHEMYSGGSPYFNEVVGGKIFGAHQSPFSFFALENSNWIIAGLDSAYNANALKLYMDGSIAAGAQVAFLQGLAKKGKKVIVLTHHNPLPDTGIPGTTPINLYTEVMNAFQGTPPPAYWYYGHTHIGAAYKPQQDGMLCRCIGHGAIPWATASDLKNSAQVEWFEQCNAGDPNNPLRVYNGFTLLRLNGTKIEETFYDETGRVAWTPAGGDPRLCAP